MRSCTPSSCVYLSYPDPYTLFTSELVLMGFAETRRLQDYRKPGSQASQSFIGLEAVFGGSGNPAYPGGQFFNMAGFGLKSEDEMKVLKVKEVKNGRLAMLAMLGYFVQAGVTHAGPYENLCAHLANPSGANILTNWGSVGGAL
jgi:light-harvesting complex I chlorophyll a/b binding protein 3